MDSTAAPTAPAAPAEALQGARADVGALAGRLMAGVSDGDLVDAMTALQVLAAQVSALEVRLLAEIDARDLPRQQLHWGSTTDWFTHLAGLTRGAGRRAVVHARHLVSERGATLGALERGEISSLQAAIVCGAVDDLPAGRDLQARAEQVVLDQARRLDASQLIRAARHLVDVVDPDRAERRDEAALARQDRAAHAGRFLSIADDGAGGVRLRGRGSVEDGAVLRAALLPLTRPAPALDPDAPGTGVETDPRDHGARMFDALVEVAQHALDTDRVPASHGARARLSVTVSLDDLLQRPGHDATSEAVTDDGVRLPVAAVRRLACDAEVVPVCLGTASEVLDVGRSARLVTPALWRALITRDRHCAFPGCTRPPVMCHAHHIVHWADGGHTRLDNLVLLCGAHHRVVHHSPWRVRSAPRDGRPEFLPPQRGPSGGVPVWIRHRRCRQ